MPPVTSPSGDNLVIFSVATNGYQHVWSDCLASQRAYAARLGAGYLLLSGRYGLTPREAAWLKIAMLRRLLLEPAETVGWVAFFDADCLVRSTAPDPRSLGKTYPNAGLFAAEGLSGNFNSGVLFSRNRAEVGNIFETMLNDSGKAAPADIRTAYENGHFIQHATGHPAVQVIGPEWNSTDSKAPDRHVLHFTGPLRDEHRPLPVRHKYWGKLMFAIRRIVGKDMRPSRERLEALAATYEEDMRRAIAAAGVPQPR